jgi:hypothetical protein
LNDILSSEDCINFEAGLHHTLDAEDLLEFTIDLVDLSNPKDSVNIDLKRRATQFTLEVIARIQGLSLSNSNITDDSQSNIFQLIISIIFNASKKVCNI